MGPKRERRVTNIKISMAYFKQLMDYGASPELIKQIKIGRDLVLSAKSTMKYSVVTILETD